MNYRHDDDVSCVFQVKVLQQEKLWERHHARVDVCRRPRKRRFQNKYILLNPPSLQRYLWLERGSDELTVSIKIDQYGITNVHQQTASFLNQFLFQKWKNTAIKKNNVQQTTQTIHIIISRHIY